MGGFLLPVIKASHLGFNATDADGKFCWLLRGRGNAVTVYEDRGGYIGGYIAASTLKGLGLLADTLAKPKRILPLQFAPQRVEPMSSGNPSEPAHFEQLTESEDKYLLRNKRQIRSLLQALMDQRAIITAHMAGRDQSFPTAVLEVDADEEVLLLDASQNEACNRAAEQSKYLTCYAQLDRVNIRFRLHMLTLFQHDGQWAFRAKLPEFFYHLQRRESYRLETPITESPTCLIREETTAGEQFDLQLRVIDISGGGIAVSLTPGILMLEPQHTYRNCLLQLPEATPIAMQLTVCSQRKLVLPNGNEGFRIGLQFAHLPRGADEAIQRYIFRVDRQRNARKSGVF